MPRSDGIDVAHWQGWIDWPAVPPTVQWVAVQGLKGDRPDPWLTANRAGMAGRRVRLVYGYPTGPNDPDAPSTRSWADQAATFAATVGELDPAEGIMLDAESADITEAKVLEWLGVAEVALGRRAAVYTGRYVAGGSVWASPRIFDGTRPRIFAAYTDPTTAAGLAAPYGWAVWQWSGTGAMAGVSGACDLDQVDDWAAFDPEPFYGWARVA